MFKIFRTLAMGMLAAAISAAPTAAQGFSYGLQGGINVSDLSSDQAAVDSEIGFRGGGVLRYDFAPDGLIGVHFGATYSRKGASETEGGASGDVNLDYLEVPVTLAVNIPTESSIHPRLYAGGSFNFELNCSFADSEGGVDVSYDCGEDDGGTESFDLGIRFGGGLDLDVGSNAALTLDLGYDLGLTDIATSDAADTKNRNLFFAGGVIFHP